VAGWDVELRDNSTFSVISKNKSNMLDILLETQALQHATNKGTRRTLHRSLIMCRAVQGVEYKSTGLQAVLFVKLTERNPCISHKSRQI
jgi:hypothetical protein